MERVVTCDLCGGDLRSALPVAGLETAPLVRCPGCGLVITSPRPDPAELSAFYPSTYYSHVLRAEGPGRRILTKIKRYHGGYPSVDGAAERRVWAGAAKVFGRLFLTNLPYRGTGRKLLDVGCGVGDWLAMAQSAGWEVHGVEIAPAAVEIARGRGLHQVRVGSLEEQAYPDDGFDAITLYQTLEHVYRPRSVIRECFRILKPGGEVHISVPNFASWPRVLFGETWTGMHLPLHLHHFTPRTLTEMTRSEGFSLRRVKFTATEVSLFRFLQFLFAHRSDRSFGPGVAAIRRAVRADRHDGLRLADGMRFVLEKP